MIFLFIGFARAMPITKYNKLVFFFFNKEEKKLVIYNITVPRNYRK